MIKKIIEKLAKEALEDSAKQSRVMYKKFIDMDCPRRIQQVIDGEEFIDKIIERIKKKQL